MKKYIYILILFAFIQFSACSLYEDPPFLSSSNVFENIDNARGALDGVYNSLSGWNYYSYSMQELTAGWAGLFVYYTKYEHNTNHTLYSLKPQANYKNLENVWLQSYQAIARANDIIANMKPIDNPTSNEDNDFNDVLGNAYFLRAFVYFNLVNFWGDVPLRLDQINTDNIHLGTSPAKDVYAQIIKDAEKATQLMYKKGEQRNGYPAAEAANMLLAKVYMTLATADAELQNGTSEAEYWQMAYDQAIQVYGKYSLIDLETLWGDDSGDNTDENIFEIQFNIEANSGIMKFYTKNGATLGNTWGRFGTNAEVYDDHVASYPGDPRIDATYISTWENVKKNKTEKVYPLIAHNKKFATAFPRMYKYWSKDPYQQFASNNKNFIVYRYADLLLMLAEISNELQNGEQIGYVDEVLARVGLSHNDRADDLYNQGQDGFREAIMKEYRYELLGECQDWWNERRRGYAWFKSHVIDFHNNYPDWTENIDLLLNDNEEAVMHLPLPASEVNSNEEVN